jgi:hypothetical protein
MADQLIAREVLQLYSLGVGPFPHTRPIHMQPKGP